uniref:60S ribosomal protein L29 n=1 Tax=Anser brachyrhynchus TaxID=132585 RepID=A0A8B9CTQ2_9AVES
MAKSKNHTTHNQSRKWHRNGIKKPRSHRYESLKGVSMSVNVLGLHVLYLLLMTSSLCNEEDSVSSNSAPFFPSVKIKNRVRRARNQIVNSSLCKGEPLH